MTTAQLASVFGFPAQNPPNVGMATRETSPHQPSSTHDVVAKQEASTGCHDSHGHDIARQSTIVVLHIGAGGTGQSPPGHDNSRRVSTGLGGVSNGTNCELDANLRRGLMLVCKVWLLVLATFSGSTFSAAVLIGITSATHSTEPQRRDSGQLPRSGNVLGIVICCLMSWMVFLKVFTQAFGFRLGSCPSSIPSRRPRTLGKGSALLQHRRDNSTSTENVLQHKQGQ